MTDPVPAALMRAVLADHRPVRPLAPPWRRALGLLPLGTLVVVSAPLYWGWRINLAELGPLLAWGLSGLQALVGMAIVGAGLREAVPGRSLTRRALLLTLGAAALVEVGITLVTARSVPVVVPPGVWIRYAWECLGMAALVGVPVLAAAGWLAARALPTRPALAGGLYGLGAGVVADAGVRLFCWVSEPAHVLLSHGGAILGLAAIGALAAVVVDRARARQLDAWMRLP
jgi:hypothetical protein